MTVQNLHLYVTIVRPYCVFGVGITMHASSRELTLFSDLLVCPLFIRLGVLGSAVCRYSMKSLQDLFEKSQYLELIRAKGRDAVDFWKAVSPLNLTVVPGRPKVHAYLRVAYRSTP